MDSTFTSTSRFRFRDHNEELVDGESSEGHSSSDSSSVSSSEEEEPELQSMTAQGVKHLCSELLELKQESDEDFQKNIFSNYSAFVAILKEIEGLQNELLGLKNQAFSQKTLIQDFSDSISLRFLSEETIESMHEETLDIQPSTPNILEDHTENVSEILDTLLSEHRLDDALALLELEDEIFQNLQSGGDFSSDQLMSYNSIISEKQAMLADQLVLVSKHPRVSAPELHKALFGLCQLGESNLATQLLLQYYHLHITSGICELESSRAFLDTLYIQEAAKYVFSMISQAVRSFIALNGENCPYPSELSQWLNEEIGVFAVCFNKYVAAVSEISGRLSIAVDGIKIAMSYCSLLERQRIFLQQSLVEQIRSCIEDVIRTHIDHLSKVISIFTSNDTWVLGRYSVSGILTGRNYTTVEEQPEYLFLTNSGRKFITLIQSLAEDISLLIPLQIESSILKGIMDLFSAYIVILEKALTGDTEGVLHINLPESPTQGILILSNLSTLMQFSTCVIRNLFDGIHQLDSEMDNYQIFINGVYNRLKSGFLEQFISNIFSPNANHEFGVGLLDDSRTYDLIPSVPYLELYLELKKLQKFVEDDSIDVNWLRDMLREIMDATFDWISSKCNIWTIEKENLSNHRAEFVQFILDTHFLVEIARSGGYISDNVMNVSSSIVSRLESSFISAELHPLRDSHDENWPRNAAIRALQKLQELHVKDSLQDENPGTTREESHHYIQGMSNDTLIQIDDAEIEESGTEGTPIETEEDRTFFKKELHEDGEMENSESKIQEEISPELLSKIDDPLFGDETLNVKDISDAEQK